MRDSTLAVLLTTVMLLSVPAGMVGAAAPAADAGAGPAATDAPTDRDAGPATTGTVAPALRQGNGTTEVVARLEGAALPTDRASQVASDRAKQALESQARRTQAAVVRFAERTDGVAVKQRLWLTNAVLLEVDRDRVALDAIAAVDGVERLHPNFEVAAPEPSEAAGVAATADDGDGYNATYGLDQINATEVWDAYGTQGGGVKVAVLDTGVDASHPDVDLYTEDPSNESYPGGWAEFAEDGSRVAGSTPHDTAEHGTHTSATVAGGNASGEYVGVAPAVELMHGLVLPDGEGSFTQIIAGMEWAVEQDADVISMSLGAEGHYAEMVEPVRNAQAAGTVVVASAGNSGDGTSGTPGNVYESIAVGATDVSRAVASFSSGEVVNTDADWGSDAPDDWPDSYVVPDVAAPGVAVKSAEPGGGYQHLSGTSMAAPHVAGAVALLVGASGGDASVAELKTALYRTASKPANCYPDCSPRDGNDTRYGTGIVDVQAAAELVAAGGGVTGTVTDVDGDPVAGATVTLDGGVSTTTNATGEYRLLATPGEHTVSVTGPFGYGDAETTVTVTNDSYATADFTLPDEVDGAVAAGQPAGVEAGETASATLEVANLDGYTVELAGNYSAADATLYVDGEEASFGEEIPFDGYTGNVTVTVETAPDATGTLSLQHTLDGPGGPTSLATGPTPVYDEAVQVGVVDSTVGVRYGPDVATALESALPPRYQVSVVNGTAAAVDAVDEYDAFVVQNVSTDPAGMRAFADATESGDVGVVYLSQYGPVANGISTLSEATGEPGTTSQQSRFYNFNDVFYNVTADHPITAGVGDPGERVVLQPIGFMDWFDAFDGRQLAKPGYESCGFFGCSNRTYQGSTGLAVDDASRTVLAASLGRVPTVRNEHYTDAADAILANAVEWASDAPPATVAEGQPRTASPDEAVTTTVEATNLTSLTVTVDEAFSTVDPANVSLTVDGETHALGEPVAFDGYTGNVSVAVELDDGVTGAVSLDYSFEADGETVAGNTGPTTVYEPPLTVPGDAATLQEAIDVAPHGATVEVGDGEYGPVTVRDAGNHDLTVRAASGAAPTVSAPDHGGPSYALSVAADGVTVEGLDVTMPAQFDNGVFIDGASDVTVADVTVTGGEAGVAVGSGDTTAPNTTVRNVTVSGAQVGVHVSHSVGSTVVDSSVSGAADAGVRLSYANGTTVRDSHVAGAPVGVHLQYWNFDATVANNTVTDVRTGVQVAALSTGKRVVGNDVTANRTGVRVAGRTDFLASGTDLLRNRVDAPTGVDVATDPDAVRVRYNHLRDTGVAVRTKGRERVDARLNYLGDRGPTNTSLEGPVTYDPFLTAPPAAVEAGDATAIATDLELPAGEATALGVPGPTNRSVWDVLGEEFAGDVYRYNRNAGKWQPVTGEGRHAAIEALDAYKVVPENDTRAIVSFRTAGERGPPADHPGKGKGKAKGNGESKGHPGNGNGNGKPGGPGGGPPSDPGSPPPRSPGEATLKPGWNFVAAPTYGAVEDAFANATATVTAVKPVGDGPGSQIGPAGELNGSYEFGEGAGPNVSAFAGYLVHVEDRGTLPAALSANPTAETLYGNLSLAAGLDDADPAPAGNATATVEHTVTVAGGERVRVVTLGEPYSAVLERPDEGDDAADEGDDGSASRRGPPAVAAAA